MYCFAFWVVFRSLHFHEHFETFGEKVAQRSTREGKPIVLFEDDGLVAGRSFSLANICSLQVHADLLCLGF